MSEDKKVENEETTDIPESELDDLSSENLLQDVGSETVESCTTNNDDVKEGEEAAAKHEDTAEDNPLKDDSDEEALNTATDVVSKMMGNIVAEEESSEKVDAEEKQKEEQAARIEADERSVFVNNVNFNATKDELKAFFEEHTSGKVNRVTLIVDRVSAFPKSYAYVEFESQASVEAAIAMNGFKFKGREIEVKNKRTNIHNYGGRGGRRDRGSRGGFSMPYGYPYMPYPYPPYPFAPYSRGRGGYRGH